MDLTIRDWMIVIGAGLILLVLADAVRRVIRTGAVRFYERQNIPTG